MRGRRRRQRGVWLPTFGQQLNETPGQSVVGFDIGTGDLAASASVLVLRPLTFDYPKSVGDAGELDNSMSDLIGSEYILRRIVGSLFVHRVQTPISGVDENPAVKVVAGFFVARADYSGNEDQPIGASDTALAADSYDPNILSTVREPWIWRKTWILGHGWNNATVGASQNATFSYPPSNVYYGSLSDGPKIDAKTIRRVRNDDRLFFALSATPWPIGSAIPEPVSLAVNAHLDYRLFGMLRKSRGTGTF